MNKNIIKILCVFAGITLLITGCSFSTSKEEETEKKNQTYYVGDVVNVDGIEYTVNSTEVVKGVSNPISNLTTQAKGNFLVVNVTVKNVGTEVIRVSDNSFELINGDETYPSSIEASTMGEGFFFNELSKDNSYTANVYYDLEEDVINSKDLQLKVKSSGSGDITEVIQLNK